MKLRYLSYLILVCLLFSCQDSDYQEQLPAVNGEEIDITLSANLPIVSIATKSMSSEDECNLDKIDILVFEVIGEGNNKEEVYSYRTHNKNDLGNSSTQYIRASFLKSENNEEYRIVILANLRKEVDAIVGDPDHPAKGMKKEDLLKKIQFSHEECWPVDKAAKNIRYLPMWGEANQVTIINRNTTTASLGGPIELLRAVARIEVGVYLPSHPSDGTDFFYLEEVKVFNARKEGYAVPDEIDEITVVSGSGIIDADNMRYTLDRSHNNQLKKSIYINEVDHETADDADALYLILKAYYTEKGQPQSTTTPTYYRVDFLKNIDDQENNFQRTNILRNYSYNVNISSIEGPGYEDEEKAKKSRPMNLGYNIFDWSNGEMKYVTFNGPYYLAVSESTMSLSKSAGETSFLVKTNYPTGWSAKITKGNSWLSDLDPTSSPNLEVSEPLAYVYTQNDTGEDRFGQITISCGNDYLELDVVIEQSAAEKPQIILKEITSNGEELADDHWYFSSLISLSGYPSRVLKVYWTPEDADLVMYVDPSYTWSDSNIKSTTFSGGNFTFGIQPRLITEEHVSATDMKDINDPYDVLFPSFTTDLHFWIPGEEGVQESLKITQYHEDAYAFPEESHDMNGEEYEFIIRSNTTWTAYLGSGSAGLDPQERITILTESGGPAPEGEVFRFRVNKCDPSQQDGVVALNLRADQSEGRHIRRIYPLFLKNPKEEEEGRGSYSAGDANCYMVTPGGYSVTFPVAQANADGNIRITAGENLSYKFIWTDHPNGMGADAAVKDITVNGRGADATITVTSGSEVGNAVIAVTNSAGTICWSWHIWVTEFDPDYDENDRYGYRYYHFMDRNLGALTDVPGDPKNLGLYYQWGRKDPFPSASGIRSTTFTNIYNENGGRLNMGIKQRSTGLDWGSWAQGKSELSYSIQNPLTFITNTENWLTADTQVPLIMVNFWNEFGSQDENGLDSAIKGVYDPCPWGWKTVPASTSSNSAWYNLFSKVDYDSNTNTSYIGDNSFSLGHWPHTGEISGSSGTLGSVNYGYYWSANQNGSSLAQSLRSEITPNGNSNPGLAARKSSGFPVRCMRRIDEGL